jgi:hypothetical protein
MTDSVTLSRPQLDALREIESTLVRVFRTRRTRVASSGRIAGHAVLTGRSISGTVIEALHDAGLVRYVPGPGPGFMRAEPTDEGYAYIDAHLNDA